MTASPVTWTRSPAGASGRSGRPRARPDSGAAALRSSTFRPMLSPGDPIIIAIMSICWLVCLVDFWVWWLEPVHRTSLIGLVINSIVLAYVSCNPAFFVLAANHQRNVNSRSPSPCCGPRSWSPGLLRSPGMWRDPPSARC